MHTDDGARLVSLSVAWRDPDTHRVEAISVPFDMGFDHSPWLGPKRLPANHQKRLDRLRKLHGDHAWDVVNRSEREYAFIMDWLSHQRLRMHHAKFDCLITAAGLRDHPELGCDLEPLVTWDTQLAQSILEPRETTSLKPTSVRHHIGAPLGMSDGMESAEAEALGPWKGPQTDPRYDLIPWSVLGPYSIVDAQLTLLLDEWQQAQLEDDPQLRAQIATEIKLFRVLYRMERRGVLLDRSGMLAQDKQLATLVAQAQAKLPFRPTPPAAQKYFFGAPAEGGLGRLPYGDKLTKTGRPQVDEEVIDRLVKDEVPGAAEYRAMAELKAAREKWYSAWPALAGADGRLRTCHRQARVVSGRLSVERWQAQSLPHDYQVPEGLQPPRRFLTEDPPWQLWEVDVSQAEIRVATAVSKCGPMLRAFRAGADSHDAACKLMFFRDQPLAEAKQDPSWGRLRQVAKRCNLGILYGAGAGAIRVQIAKFTGLEYDQDQVREWIYDWRRAFPPFVQALDAYADLATRTGSVRLVTGRIRPFSDYEPVHKAFNQVIQGDVADVMKLAMVQFDEEFPGRLLLQIHDSLVFRVQAHERDHIVERAQAILRETFERFFHPVPFLSDAKPFGSFAYDR